MQPYVKGKQGAKEIHKSKNPLQRESGKGRKCSGDVCKLQKTCRVKKLVKGKRQRESIWEKILIIKLRESAKREGVAKLSINAKNRSALLRCGTVLITIQEKLYRKGIIRRILLLRPFWQFSLRA